MRKPKPPRICNYFGMKNSPIIGNLETWLEPEELTYPSGGRLRRCHAINVDTGKPITVRCGLPDTFFSIDAEGGFITSSDGGIFLYHPYRKEK
jgi:hypothetical protein